MLALLKIGRVDDQAVGSSKFFAGRSRYSITNKEVSTGCSTEYLLEHTLLFAAIVQAALFHSLDRNYAFQTPQDLHTEVLESAEVSYRDQHGLVGLVEVVESTNWAKVADPGWIY